MTVNGKIIKTIWLAESILLTVIIGWTLLPSSNIFPPMVYSFWRIIIPFLLILGCYGQYARSKKILFAGIIGCYMFLWLLFTLIVIDEKMYDFGPIPSLQELYHRIVFVTLIGVLLLINFRTIRYRIIHPPPEIQMTEDSKTEGSKS